MSMLSSGRAALAAVSLGLVACCALAQVAPTSVDAPPAATEQRSIGEWLTRMHDASRKRAYTGTFVVSSDALLASARIWHACEGEQQIERVDALTGPPRTTFRRNDHVVTFLQDSKVARMEKREALGLFPNLLQAADTSIAEFYGAKRLGQDRVAGFEADIVLLKPKDKLRFGYRVWSEKKSGLVIKLQTLDVDGKVLEQAAFSELQIDAPVRLESLARMMNKTSGYRTERVETLAADPATEGWTLSEPVPGFRSMSCIKRAPEPGMAPSTMQWVFSDGLASVSLFVEPYDAQRHLKEGLVGMGATQSLMRRSDDWWLTAVGEVPVTTLKSFAAALQRTRK
nr:MucB/RseB C-terminal domain-containing protein [Variovorax boronicumulans]